MVVLDNLTSLDKFSKITRTSVDFLLMVGCLNGAFLLIVRNQGLLSSYFAEGWEINIRCDERHFVLPEDAGRVTGRVGVN